MKTFDNDSSTSANQKSSRELPSYTGNSERERYRSVPVCDTYVDNEHEQEHGSECDFDNDQDDAVGSESLNSLEEETILTRTRSEKQEPHFSSPPYSRFGRRAKLALVIQCAFTGFFSTIAGAIYYPVLTVIEQEFNISEEAVNVTVVVYFIFQGVSPTIMGGFADSLGRRPVVLFSVMVYFVACVGLACSKTYGQIVGLRCLQAAGIAPVIAINSGIMGDVTTRMERGGYVGYVSGFQVVGSAFGALIGAGLSSRWSWRAIFWFLAIGSGICLIVSFIILPETKRTVTGNGSIPPKQIVNKAPILGLPMVRKSLHLDNPDYDTLLPPTKINILASLSVFMIPEISAVLLCAGLQFAMWTTHQTALSIVLSKNYHLSVAKIGLCFLPAGICTLISVVTSGRYLNWSYERNIVKHREWIKTEEAKFMTEHKIDIQEARKLMEGDFRYTFNIFKARLQPALVTILISCCGFISFGWCIYAHAPIAALLCLSGFSSLFSNCILTMSVTLIVDLFPSKSSTATGCLNLFRCILSAVFVVALSRMAASMTYGGVFTLMGGLTGASSFVLLTIITHGKKLTYKRRQQENLIIEKNAERAAAATN
ncbi:hypothetical protein HG535_0D02500 [Zygotorulaspora mrakii]|uniref:Major facilitator superfamily (MFS) profile domain-containing protein n=1 Tax=Zygotorulaspora mrakii TaxID=42260 RepID=A0A7H9B454_ZYGMR|nr:uncharacterized protein HG535_0D02500 [Zygotorulaspora mrakii]QLG72542.1 hypothetical protein HG535_0D02500 [Zygotorulaspora mrakii]